MTSWIQEEQLIKDGIAKEIGWEREDIDYVGVSKAVEHNLINSEKVKQYQAINQSSFVTVRVAHRKLSRKPTTLVMGSVKLDL